MRRWVWLRKYGLRSLVLIPVFFLQMMILCGKAEYMDYQGAAALARLFCVPALGPSLRLQDLPFELVGYLLLLYLYCQEFRGDFIISYNYVFPRYGSVGRWLEKKAAGLFLGLAVQLLMLMAGCGLLGLCAGYRFAFTGETVGVLAGCYLATLLWLFWLLITVNLLSLPLGEIRGFVVGVVLLLVLSGLMIPMNPGQQPQISALFWNPMAHGLYLIHEEAKVPAILSGDYYGPMADFALWKSALYLAGISLAELGIFGVLMKKRDMLQMIGGSN